MSPTWLYIGGIIVAGIFTIGASLFGSKYIVKNGNSKAMEDFKLQVTTQITKLETISKAPNTQCPGHHFSFSRVHEKIEDGAVEVQKKFDMFSQVVANLDKNVAVLGEQLKNMNKLCVERGMEINNINKKVDKG